MESKKRPIWKPVAHDLVGMLVLAFFSLSVGLFLNHFHAKPLPLVYLTKVERAEQAASKLAAQQPRIVRRLQTEPPAPVKYLTLAEFQSFLQEKRGVVLDARLSVFYRMGHVPGAFSLSADQFQAEYPKIKESLKLDQPIAIYCANATCTDSEALRRALLKLGYTNLFLFKGGIEEWKKAGLPVEKSP